ncbi:MAG: MFS transporter [Sphingobacterium sp.]
MNNSKIFSKDFLLACLGCFLLFVNFYMLLAAMPLAIQQNMSGTPKEMSLVVSIYILGIVLMRPFSGLISDRLGALRVALITQFIFAVCTLLYLGFSGIYPLLIIRLVHGIFHSISTTSHAAMAINMIPDEKKGEGIGYYGLAMSLSMVLGPALGLFLLQAFSFQVLIWVAVLFSVFSWLSTLFIPKSLVWKESSAKQAKAPFKLSSLLEMKAVPVCISILVFSFSYSSLISFMAVYTAGLGIGQAAMYFFISFAISILVSRPAIGKLLDRRGPSYLMFPNLLLFALGLIVLSMSSSVLGILCSGLILGLAYGAIFPSFQTITIRLSPPENAGSATATFFLFYDGGFGLGAFVLAFIASFLGYAMMYMLVSGLVILSLLFYYFLFHRKQNLASVEDISGLKN